MKALVYTAPKTFEYQTVSDPVPATGEVLIKIESVGICGSDMHAYLGHDERRIAPLILGHEAAGTIVGGVRDGERVAINPLVTCGTCPACLAGRNNICPDRQIISMMPREGAFAELLAMPAVNVISAPDNIAYDQIALIEPIACGWHAVRLSLDLPAVDSDGSSMKALVIGGGAVGVGSALSLVAQGVNDITIVEPNILRRTLLQKTLECAILAPDELDTGTMFDLVYDAAGYSATRALASAQVKPGGVIMHTGLGEAAGGLDLRRMTLQEISCIGTYTYTSEDFRQTAQALFDGRLGSLDWFETRPLSEGLQAFVDIESALVEVPKLILKPH